MLAEIYIDALLVNEEMSDEEWESWNAGLILDELAARNHTLGLYCVNCDRWHVVDLNDQIQAGRGNVVISEARFRCHDCGELAEKQLRPPVPEIGTAGAYI